MSDWTGEELNGRRLGKLDWSQAAFVVLSGAKPNVCGHAMLFVGGGFGHYFHVPGIPRIYDKPRYVPGTAFGRYLTGSGKRELGRRRIAIPCPDAAERKLLQLMDAKWPYLLLPSNCVSFVQEVARAGGNYWDFANCPTAEPLAWEWLQKNVLPLFTISAESCPVVK